MFRALVLSCVVLLVGTPAVLAEDVATPDEVPAALDVLQPVLDDDSAPNLGPEDGPVLTPEAPDDLTPNTDGDETPVLTPSSDDDVAVNLPKSTDLPPAFVVTLQMNADGTAPSVALQVSADGQDAELLVDGVVRAVLKGGAGLTLDRLALVYI